MKNFVCSFVLLSSIIAALAGFKILPVQGSTKVPETRVISGDEVAATVVDVHGNIVAVEVIENGQIEIYSFYGDYFAVGENVTLIMVGDAIIDVREGR